MQQITLTDANPGVDFPYSVVLPYFARHETFHPRFGWLKRGFDAVQKNGQIFAHEDAHVELGVGKNMARAIRYWCTAFKVIEAISLGKGYLPTAFGMQLLADNGYDPFLEDPASLWLLHWSLLKPPCLAAAWYFTFHLFRKPDFSVVDLTASLINYKNNLNNRIVDSSLQKDVNCILRMYAEPNLSVQKKNSVLPDEDSLDCPFADLGMIQTTIDPKVFSFYSGYKTSLPAEIITSCCLEFAHTMSHSQRTIALPNLLFAEGSPGLAFKLSESALRDALEEVSECNTGIALSDSANITQLTFTEQPTLLARKLLDTYYKGI